MENILNKEIKIVSSKNYHKEWNSSQQVYIVGKEGYEVIINKDNIKGYISHGKLSKEAKQDLKNKIKLSKILAYLSKDKKEFSELLKRVKRDNSGIIQDILSGKLPPNQIISDLNKQERYEGLMNYH